MATINPHFLFKENGAFRHEPVSTEGRGPGEFEKFQQTSYWSDDDSIWFTTLFRILKFTKEGKFIQQWPTTAKSSSMKTGDVYFETSSHIDTTLALLTPFYALTNSENPTPEICLPVLPPQHNSPGISEMHSITWHPDGAFLLTYPRFPYLIFADVTNEPACNIHTVLNLEPAYSHGTTLTVGEQGNFRRIAFRSLTASKVQFDGCWLVQSPLIGDHYLQICDQKPIRRIRFTLDGKPADNLTPNGTDGNILFLRDNNRLDDAHYQVLIPGK